VKAVYKKQEREGWNAEENTPGATMAQGRVI